MHITKPVDPGTSLPAVRDAVQRKIRGSSLRRVAVEVGMSPGGLTHFLEGADPQRPTFERLRIWFGAQPENLDTMGADQAALAIEMLVAGIPADQRAAAAKLVLDAVTRVYGGSLPAWVVELRQRAQRTD